MTNQKNSGRCWIFATLNVIRLPFIKNHNLEEFEFSQGYLFFWDKIERCNYFLHNIVKTARRGEAVDGRLVSFLLQVSVHTFIIFLIYFFYIHSRKICICIYLFICMLHNTILKQCSAFLFCTRPVRYRFSD